MKSKSRLIILCILSLVILTAVGINIRASDQGILFDETIMEYVHNRTGDTGIGLMKVITFFGSSKFFILTCILLSVYLYRIGNMEGVKLVVLSIVGSYGLNFILKSIFIRTRPLQYFLIEKAGYSFPSGHAMVSMSFYTTMTYLITRRRRKNKKFLWLLNFIFIGLIGFSRIYLGVHWPTDILMGYLLGYVFFKLIK